jgi:hypothetical protein
MVVKLHTWFENPRLNIHKVNVRKPKCGRTDRLMGGRTDGQTDDIMMTIPKPYNTPSVKEVWRGVKIGIDLERKNIYIGLCILNWKELYGL